MLHMEKHIARQRHRTVEDKDRGFTLVELIVVLVILAVLAALMVPALLGWIDKAKGTRILADARNFQLAVQATSAIEYGAENAYTGTAKYQTTYESVTNMKQAPDAKDKEKERIRLVYDLMDAAAVPYDFAAIALVQNGIIQQIRFKDCEQNIVYEWTAANPSWTEIEAYERWAGDVAAKSVPNDVDKVWWNGLQPSGPAL